MKEPLHKGGQGREDDRDMLVAALIVLIAILGAFALAAGVAGSVAGSGCETTTISFSLSRFAMRRSDEGYWHTRRTLAAAPHSARRPPCVSHRGSSPASTRRWAPGF